MKKIAAASAILLLSAGAALAGHGKAGLWNVTTTLSMPDMPQMPPEAMEMMKKRGMSMPGMGGQPMTRQVCMTQAEVDADKPPRTSGREINCDTSVTKATPGFMAADTVCHGRMEGAGHVEVSWQGMEHYSGTYSFKGNMGGQPHEMSSSFKGDWVKADCGDVKPFTPRPHD